MLKIKIIPTGEIKEVKPLKISEYADEKIFYYKNEKGFVTCADYETGCKLYDSDYKTAKGAEKHLSLYLDNKRLFYKELKAKIRKGDGGTYKLKIINEYK